MTHLIGSGRGGLCFGVCVWVLMVFELFRLVSFTPGSLKSFAHILGVVRYLGCGLAWMDWGGHFRTSEAGACFSVLWFQCGVGRFLVFFCVWVFVVCPDSECCPHLFFFHGCRWLTVSVVPCVVGPWSMCGVSPLLWVEPECEFEVVGSIVCLGWACEAFTCFLAVCAVGTTRKRSACPLRAYSQRHEQHATAGTAVVWMSVSHQVACRFF